MITGIDESQTLTKQYHVNVNVILMVENVTRIKSGITINVGVSVKIRKKIMFVKNVISGMLLHVVLEMANI